MEHACVTDVSALTSPQVGWRAPILERFKAEVAGAARLTAVVDHDRLLSEEAILRELANRGFDFVPYDDPVAFRHAYEFRYRRSWDDGGGGAHLVVVVQDQEADFDSLPFDVLGEVRREGRCLRLSIGHLFPRLSPTVLRTLDRGTFDLLFEAQSQDPPEKPLGAAATRDYALRHVYGVSPETITTPAGLLRALLRWHYRGFPVSAGFEEHLLQALRRNDRWNDWPLERVVPNRGAFFAFLNERWPLFVRRSRLGEARAPADNDLRIPGPPELPFGHADVRVYIDNLFQEGLLAPAEGVGSAEACEAWMRVGIRADDQEHRSERFRRLLKRSESELPGADVNHRRWVEFAWIWAELLALRWEMAPGVSPPDTLRVERLHDRVEAAFADWMKSNFASLHNLSAYERPVVVHHIPRHMALKQSASGTDDSQDAQPVRQALVVLDGLALDQWIVLRNPLREQLGDGLDVLEDACFAWAPTSTTVSRQAIFSGKEPFAFGSSVDDTKHEPRHWTTFWEGHGLAGSEVSYVVEGLDRVEANFLDEVRRVADNGRLRALGIVINKIDEAMHGTTTGSAGLHALVRQWAHSGALARLLEALSERGFDVVVTSDHGNVEAHGMGRLDAGAVVKSRSVRAHVFRDRNTRAAAAASFPEAIEWAAETGLPSGFFPLLAPGRRAFLREGRHAVGHGGIALEEVIVPFIRFRQTG